MHFLRLLGGGNLAGADGPHGLVGDDHARREVLAHAFEAGFELGLHNLEGLLALALGKGFANTEDRLELALEGGEHLLVDEGVGLLEIRAALAVAENDVVGEDRTKHADGDLAGVGAAGLGMHVLGAELDDGAVEGLADRLDRGEWRGDHDFDVGLFADFGDEFLHERNGVGGGLVHLPVAGDEFFSNGHSVLKLGEGSLEIRGKGTSHDA